MIEKRKLSKLAMKAKRMISRLVDQDDLRILRGYCDERDRELGRRAHEAALAATKIRMSGYCAGMQLWCCAAGMFIGGPFQRGDEFSVIRDMGFKRRDLWVRHTRSGKAYSMNAALVHRYDLRAVPPENPVNQDERDRMERLSNRLANLPPIGGKW